MGAFEPEKVNAVLHMKMLTINLPEKTAAEADEAARKLGLSVEDLVRASLEEKLQQLSLSFDEAAKRVLEKNAELYQRLA